MPNEPKRESNSSTTSFETIGIENKFNFIHKDRKIESTDLIDLNNEFLIGCIRTPQREGFGNYYSIILFDQEGVVGHADFRIFYDDPAEAQATFSIYSGIDQDNFDNLPTPISKGIKELKSTNPINAFEISDQYQGKHLGTLLWAIGCGVMEMNNVKEIYIGDTTKQKTGTSFYEHQGAVQKDKKITEMKIGEPLREKTIKGLYQQTHLTLRQEDIVKAAFA
ncbi:MAG TPA: hypothetical protein VG895_03605 [Patescibacteria group bacterium]|nr:hypothetical protein [Patescibacteria group bacterium]